MTWDGGSQGPPQDPGLGDDDVSSGRSRPPHTLPLEEAQRGPTDTSIPSQVRGKPGAPGAPQTHSALGDGAPPLPGAWLGRSGGLVSGLNSGVSCSIPWDQSCIRPHSGPRVHDGRDRPDTEASGLTGSSTRGGARHTSRNTAGAQDPRGTRKLILSSLGSSRRFHLLRTRCPGQRRGPQGWDPCRGTPPPLLYRSLSPAGLELRLQPGGTGLT